MTGATRVKIDDGTRKTTYHLNRSYYGLYLSPMIWREIDNFSSGAVCMVLASAPYIVDDYLRDYEAFVALAQ